VNSKERAGLMAQANSLTPIFSIGKSSLTPEITQAITEALEARELIKINVLKNCMDESRDIANTLAERTQSAVVQVIGNKIVLYKKSRKKNDEKKKSWNSGRNL
jgi:RNA-binding protein